MTYSAVSHIVHERMAKVAEQADVARDSPAIANTAPKDEYLPLALAVAAGREDAARTLINALGSSMLRTVRKVLGSSHIDIDDVMQDAAVALVGALAGFRGECSVAHFANRIALLTAMAARRRSITRQRFTDSTACLNEVVDTRVGTPLDSVLAARQRELVRSVLDELPTPLAEACALHFVLGYSVEEIAAATGCPPNTVWSRLRLAKARLRQRLLEESPSEARVRSSED